MKYTTRAERKKAYLALAKWIDKVRFSSFDSKDSDQGGICLQLRMIYFDIPLEVGFGHVPGEWCFDRVGEFFPEYGFINPHCRTHTNDNERIVALLFAAALCDDKKFVPLTQEELITTK